MFIDVIFGFAWNKLKSLFASDPCFKTEQGYNCHHRVMSNGQKECGNERQ